MQIKTPAEALSPLAAIADAFDANLLDMDGARKFWGQPDNHRPRREPDRVVLYTGLGGRILLTLADAFTARNALTYGMGIVPALKPLVEISRAYDENCLDGPARKFRPRGDDASPMSAVVLLTNIVLVTDVNGMPILTLQDVTDGHISWLQAREDARQLAAQLAREREATRTGLRDTA
ncbi:hypothetical protein ACOI1H_14640 [Loktanella sp. DJP18]|uniref:hypothetical protein n=1 Tax=Loktanella sp. DJP18 TaxID=3409788 RepID=UPI003BB6CD23